MRRAARGQVGAPWLSTVGSGTPITTPATFLSLNQKSLTTFPAFCPVWSCNSESRTNVMIADSRMNRIARTWGSNGTEFSPSHSANPKQQTPLTSNWLRFHEFSSSSAWNRAHPLATLSFYVSHLRRPASSAPSSGDQCAAGPDLNRFCKSNERTPAAVPAGFFIAPRPDRARAKVKNSTQHESRLQ